MSVIVLLSVPVGVSVDNSGCIIECASKYKSVRMSVSESVNGLVSVSLIVPVSIDQ